MATSINPAVAAADVRSGRRAIVHSSPLVLWHLLSLDAPTVAALWTWFIARANHVLLPFSAVLAMGIAVWLLYAADRLLDSRTVPEHAPGLEARHLFHRRHQRTFRTGICLASIALALLLPSLDMRSLRLYLILGAPLFGYFILIHAASLLAREGSRRMPKEIAVGVLFSAAVFIPTIARGTSLREALFPAALLFAAVCSLNCLFIYAWEHHKEASYAHMMTRIALGYLPTLSVVAGASGVVLAVARRDLPWMIPTACAMSAALLLVLHWNRHRLSATTLRAAADICLLTPIVLLPLM